MKNLIILSLMATLLQVVQHQESKVGKAHRWKGKLKKSLELN